MSETVTRRSFLAGAALATGGMLLPSAIASHNLPSEQFDEMGWHITDGWHEGGKQRWSVAPLDVGDTYGQTGDTYPLSPRLLDHLRTGPGAVGPLDYPFKAVVSRVGIIGNTRPRHKQHQLGHHWLYAEGFTVLWVCDITNVLHEFACQCAEEALKLIPNPDARSIAAIEAKRQWLRGEIDGEALAVARLKARDVVIHNTGRWIEGFGEALDWDNADRDSPAWTSMHVAHAAPKSVAWFTAVILSTGGSTDNDKIDPTVWASLDRRLTTMVMSKAQRSEK